MDHESQSSQASAARLGPIGQFAARTAIIVSALIVSLWFTFIQINGMVSSAIDQLKSGIGGRQFWSKIEQELERAASPEADVAAEKKQKIIAQVRTISDRWRPFAADIVTAVTGNDRDSAKK